LKQCCKGPERLHGKTWPKEHLDKSAFVKTHIF
jgi:hypothetical protein